MSPPTFPSQEARLSFLVDSAHHMASQRFQPNQDDRQQEMAGNGSSAAVAGQQYIPGKTGLETGLTKFPYPSLEAFKDRSEQILKERGAEHLFKERTGEQMRATEHHHDMLEVLKFCDTTVFSCNSCP